MNLLFKKNYGFDLFKQFEKAIFDIMKPCHSEEEFNHHIQALYLLIENMDPEDMKKVSSKKDNLAFIGLLSELLKDKNIKCDEAIIDIFRKIHKLRSARYPVHDTDLEVIDLIIKLTGKFPPNYIDLWYKILNEFENSLKNLENCLSTEISGKK
ncbi:hypothetical protein [Thermoplasma sp. Kam2015]|uniref:hypothetical protein n=1 Tax=Thermoplasma sp. Kam2015 TaxID=2094122 RepID=UPI001293405E|nr:hypothetical protein [Thermoplasma sp. Kam2015]